jgi:hypothetical protein
MIGDVRIYVRGRLGPTMRSAFGELLAEEVPRHHVLRLPGTDLDDLMALMLRLAEHGIEVDRVVRRPVSGVAPKT